MNSIFKAMYKKKSNGGFTLLEVLISMVVLAVGLFGLAGLQVMSVRSNTSAYYRSIASMMAYDIMDRMRANPVGLAAGDYDDVNNAADNPSCAAGGVDCSTQQLAFNDLNEWLNKPYKLAQLPGSSASITKVAINGLDPVTGLDNGVLAAYNVTVSITWNDFSSKSAESNPNINKFGDEKSETFTYSSIIRVKQAAP